MSKTKIDFKVIDGSQLLHEAWADPDAAASLIKGFNATVAGYAEHKRDENVEDDAALDLTTLLASGVASWFYLLLKSIPDEQRKVLTEKIIKKALDCGSTAALQWATQDEVKVVKSLLEDIFGKQA